MEINSKSQPKTFSKKDREFIKNMKKSVEVKGNKEKIVILKGEELKQREREDKIVLEQLYQEVINVLRTYADLKDEYYNLVAVWIMGTYLHKALDSYPYLFINAMKGSGKSRLLRLISLLSHNGSHELQPTEAMLFRMPPHHTLCLDEFEGLSKKENAGLRQVLNASYKRGMTITRAKKVKSKEGEEYELEKFEPYKPIVIANINGMEEVLSDRCVPIMIEKSQRKDIMLLQENFHNNPLIEDLKERLTRNLVKRCSVVYMKNNTHNWNIYVNIYLYIHTFNTQTTLTPQFYSELRSSKSVVLCRLKREVFDEILEEQDFYYKVINSGLNGRNLELFFPLFYVSHILSDTILDETLKISKLFLKSKKESDIEESLDISVYDFISRLTYDGFEFISMRNLINDFRIFLGLGKFEDPDLNARWLGKSFKRLDLILDRKRKNNGMSYRLDIEKAKKKLVMFK